MKILVRIPYPASGYTVEKRTVTQPKGIMKSPKRFQVDTADINERTRVAVIGRLVKAVAENTKALVRIEGYTVDNSVMISKMIEMMTKLTKMVK